MTKSVRFTLTSLESGGSIEGRDRQLEALVDQTLPADRGKFGKYAQFSFPFLKLMGLEAILVLPKSGVVALIPDEDPAGPPPPSTPKFTHLSFQSLDRLGQTRKADRGQIRPPISDPNGLVLRKEFWHIFLNNPNVHGVKIMDHNGHTSKITY